MLLFKRRRRPSVSASVSPEIVALVEGSGLFDPGWYLAAYPEIAGFGGGPLGHFCEYGLRETRDPGPEFSHAVYRRRAPDAFKGSEPPFVHAMRGRSLETEPLWSPGTPDALRRMMLRTDVFDAAFYLRDNPDIARAGGDPFAHFCSNGAYERRQPGPAFEPDFYIEQHPDFALRYATPIEDWLRYGRPKGWAGSGPPLYARWIEAHDTLTSSDAEAIRRDAERDPPPPVAIIHRLDAAALAHLAAIRAGLRAQIGVAWRAWFVPAPGLDAAAWRRASEACAGEPGLRCLPPGASLGEDPGGAPAGTGPEPGITLACFGAVALRPHAAYAFARGLADAGAEAAYSDHDSLRGSERTAPRFKPAFSAEYLRRAAYTGPVLALRGAPGPATLDEAAPDTDADAAAAALLRRFEARPVARLPLILYHRLGPEPARAAPAAEAPPPLPDPAPTVDIVIPTRDRAGLLRACIDSIRERTDYPAGRFGILVVDNGSAEPETLAYLDALRATPGVRVVPAPGRFNFSRINNAGVAASDADIVVLLNNDTTVNRADWLRHLAGHAGDPSVGAVGAQLLYPDGTVQHGGVVLGIQGVGAHRHVGVPGDALDPPDATRDASAVTGACLAIRRRLFLDLGGLDPVLEVAFNDVKLCVSAVEAGYRTVYVGLPLLHHHESKSRGLDDTPAKVLRNLREATYVVSRFPNLFRDDPSYNPNLSLNRIDDLAFPPRVVRPWRRGRAFEAGRPPRVLLLSSVHRRGYGVPVVLALQARALLARGFEVIVGGPVRDDDTPYPGCRRIGVVGEQQAANLAVSEGVDCVVAHTPPFFGIARHVGRRPLFYAMDYGEPNPEFFEDRAQREAIDREKRLSLAFARRVFCISRAIYHQQYRRDAIVARLGNAHLDTWSEAWAGRRPALRERYGFGDRFVVLNVCRFHRQERDYKGVDRTIEIAGEFPILYPDLADACVFALAGRGDPEDVAFVEASGLAAYPNVTDAELLDLYAASDVYMNFSRWEGYNLGIGQALAMGLPVIASDIEAHREFPIDTAATVMEACALLARAIRAGEAARTAFVEPWAASLDRVCDTLEADLAAQDTGWL